MYTHHQILEADGSNYELGRWLGRIGLSCRFRLSQNSGINLWYI